MSNSENLPASIFSIAENHRLKVVLSLEWRIRRIADTVANLSEDENHLTPEEIFAEVVHHKGNKNTCDDWRIIRIYDTIVALSNDPDFLRKEAHLTKKRNEKN